MRSLLLTVEARNELERWCDADYPREVGGHLLGKS